MPTALDNGQRTAHKLLRTVVARLLGRKSYVLDVGLDLAGTFEDAIQEGERLVAYGIGPAGDALGLAVREADAELLVGKFVGARAEQAYAASVLRISGSQVERTTLQDVETTFPKLQPLPDGEILLVGARAARRQDGTHDLNAKVYGSDGKLRREFFLGDGIEDVQTTADGQIGSRTSMKASSATPRRLVPPA